MSLLLAALEGANLTAVRDSRRRGDIAAVRAATPLLQKADLLVLGAFADEIRKVDVGDDVRFCTHAASGIPSTSGAGGAGGAGGTPVPALSGTVQVARAGKTGFDFLREVAIARICADLGACVRVDWDDAGFELSQVALGFGANEIWGALVNKRGLPILDEEMKKVKGEGMVSVQALKRIELQKLLSYVGRNVVFVDAMGRAEVSEEVSHAT